MASQLDHWLPLKPITFHVLLSLVDGERHGYGLVRDIEDRTGGRMRLEPANLYRSLKWMLDSGLIEEAERRAAGRGGSADDERRRYYRATRLGVRVAEAEAARLEALVREARARHLLKSPRRLL
jgi:DNA-binding PadR family transcriptional regulator